MTSGIKNMFGRGIVQGLWSFYVRVRGCFMFKTSGHFMSGYVVASCSRLLVILWSFFMCKAFVFFMCKVYGHFMLFDVQGMQVFYVQGICVFYVQGVRSFYAV